MKRKLFTFLVAFLTTVGNAVWGQTTTEIDISAIVSNTSFSIGSEDVGYIAKHGNYDTEGNTLKITKGGSYKIKGNASQSGTNSNVQISIAEGITVTLELDNLRTDASLGNVLHTNTDEAEKLVKADRCALEIGKGATVTLIWNNVCKLTSGGDRAGINVKEDATLIMKGSNTYELEVGSWNNASNGAITYGAGIGGDKTGASFGTIIIESGDIRAYSYAQGSNGKAYGAGIGGGYCDNTPKASTSGSIIIKGGNIEATSAAIQHATSGEDYGAGIGGGNSGTCTNITITGGTITATGTKGDDIGNGASYSENSSPSVIVAPAEPNGTAPSVTIPNDLTNALIVRDGNTKVNGEVTLPEGTDQIYAPNITGSGQLKAYKITYKGSKIDEGEGTHTITGLDVAEKAVKDMYYNAGVTVEVPSNISCNLHYFVGWYKSGTPASIVETTGTEGSSIATFTLPSEDPTSDKQEAFTITPVWVDKEQPIMAEADHEWTDSGTDNPDIDTAPSEAIGLLTYTLVAGTDAGNRLNDVEMSGNKFKGTPKLETEDNGYKELPDVTVTVKVKDSQSSKSYTVKTPIVIHNGEIKVTSVSVTDIDHEYNGQSHNGWNKDAGASDAYHLLTFSFTVNGETPSTDQKLREGVYYIISGYTKDGKTETAQNDESLEIKEAGTYSNIKLKAIRESVKFIKDGQEVEEYETGLSVTIDTRDLTLVATDNNPITYKTNETAPDFSTNASTYVKAGNTIGKDAVTINSGITATVDGEADAWKTQPGKYKVIFTAGSNATVSNTNYELEEGTSITRDLIVKGEVTDPTVKPGEGSEWTLDTDGNFTREYNGQTPNTGSIGSLVVTLANGTTETLEEDEGFEVAYTNAKKDVGEYEVTITFKESTYITSGSKTVKLKITEKPMTVDFNFPSVITDTENINWSKSSITYTGNVTGEEPTISDCYLEVEVSTVFLRDFSLKDNGDFKQSNYTINYIGSTSDITANVEEGKQNADDEGNYDVELPDDEITIDPNDDDDDKDHGHGGSDINRPAKYYNIYVDTAATSDGVELSLSKDVVKEGNQVSVYIDKILEGYDAENMKVQIKRSLYGYWEEIEEGVQPGEYIIYNIYTDIYVKVTDVEKEDATGIDDLEGVKAYAKDGSIYVYTPNREEVIIISMSGAIIKNEEQVGLQSYSVSRGIYIVRVGDEVFKVKL